MKTTGYNPNEQTYRDAMRSQQAKRSWLQRVVRRVCLYLYDWREEVATQCGMAAKLERAQPAGQEMNARQWAATCLESVADDITHA